MADFTLSSGSICRPFRSPWGAFPTMGRTVSTGVSSAAIYMGRVVTLDFTESDPSSNHGHVKASTVNGFHYGVGIAAELQSGSTAVAGTAISVWEANPMVEFQAVTKGGTLQSSQVGLTKTLQWDSTLNIQWVDLGASTAADHRVVITQLLDAQGDSGGMVAFRFLSDRRHQGSTVNSSTPYLAFYR